MFISDMIGTLFPPLVNLIARGVEASSTTGKEMMTGSQEEPLLAVSSDPWLADDIIFTVP